MKKRPIPDVLTAEEQARLLAAMPSGTRLQRRNLAMLRLMLNAGLRSQEVCDLRVVDIQWPSGKLLVRGKGGRQRVLWLANDDINLLATYYQETKPSGILFQTGTGKPITTRFVRYMVASLGRKTGIKRVHPHLLRHTFACSMLSYTKNLFLVSRALGHSSISTTQIYLHLVDGELEEAMKGMGGRNGENP
jgi:site-specific recombinase XerD